MNNENQIDPNDNQPHEDILNLIRKLMAMSQSSNPNEAAMALSRAQKLMRIHKVSAEDLEVGFAITEEQVDAVAGVRERRYGFILINLICKAFGLTSFFSPTSSGSIAKVTFIGPRERLKPGIYVFSFLSRQMKAEKKRFTTSERPKIKAQIEAASSKQFLEILRFIRPLHDKERTTINDLDRLLLKAHGIYEAIDAEVRNHLKRATDMYLAGWIEAVDKQVMAFAMEESEQLRLEDYMNKHHPTLNVSRSSSRRYISDDELQAYHQGRKDGASGFKLYHGITGLDTPRLK